MMRLESLRSGTFCGKNILLPLGPESERGTKFPAVTSARSDFLSFSKKQCLCVLVEYISGTCNSRKLGTALALWTQRQKYGFPTECTTSEGFQSHH